MELGSSLVCELRLERIRGQPGKLSHVAMDAEFALVVRELESVYQSMLGDLFDFLVADVAKSLVPYFQGCSQFSVGLLNLADASGTLEDLARIECGCSM
jgi:hypothetical protein